MPSWTMIRPIALSFPLIALHSYVVCWPSLITISSDPNSPNVSCSSLLGLVGLRKVPWLVHPTTTLHLPKPLVAIRVHCRHLTPPQCAPLLKLAQSRVLGVVSGRRVPDPTLKPNVAATLAARICILYTRNAGDMRRIFSQ